MPRSPRFEDALTDDLRFILENALSAPSGDNLQEMRWTVRGNTLELIRQSEEDIMDAISGSRASWISIGAIVENAVIAASVRGYRVAVAYTSDAARPACVASLALASDASIVPDPLAGALATRVTNRKPYRRAPLRAEERDALLGAGAAALLADRQSIVTLARAVAVYDRFLFSTRDLHDKFFMLINWTKRADARRRRGLYFPTLEAPPLSRPALWLLGQWGVMRVGILLGLHRGIAFMQGHIYRRAAAYGAVLVSGDTSADWADAGRRVERVWLTATAAGLSLQPLTGTLFLAFGIDGELCRRMFSPAERERVRAARGVITHAFGAPEGSAVAFLFRVGRAAPPSARTSRVALADCVDLDTREAS